MGTRYCKTKFDEYMNNKFISLVPDYYYRSNEFIVWNTTLKWGSSVILHWKASKMFVVIIIARLLPWTLCSDFSPQTIRVAEKYLTVSARNGVQLISTDFRRVVIHAVNGLNLETLSQREWKAASLTSSFHNFTTRYILNATPALTASSWGNQE